MDVKLATHKYLVFTNYQHFNIVSDRSGTSKQFSYAKISGLIQ